MKNPDVRKGSDAIRRVAVSALLSVAGNEESPASAKAQAAVALLTLVGDLGPRATPLKDREAADLTELTPEELAQELAKLGQ